MSQQVQKNPSVGDVKFTNQLAKKAMDGKNEGVVLYLIPVDKVMFLSYHDAGWANCPQWSEDPYYQLTQDEEDSGMMTDGPPGLREKKSKKINTKGHHSSAR